MFAAIELHVFDEPIRNSLRYVKLGKIRARISQQRPYVARLSLQGARVIRHYLKPRWDYRQARSSAASGVMLRYLIDTKPTDVYEIAEHANRRRLQFRFVRFEDGEAININHKEAIQWLSK